MNVDHVAQFPQKTWFRERLPRPVAPAFGAITIGLALAAMLAACSPSVPSMIGHGAATGAGTPAATTAATTAAGRNCGPLHAAGAHLVDAQGNPANLSGVNWFGFETESFAPHGLYARNYLDMLHQIAHLGFNTIRLPYSNQLFDPASLPTGINYTLNPDLRGLHGLALMDKIVAGAAQSGLCVILDQHRPNAAAQSELWYTPQLSEARWLSDWVMLAQHYRDTPTVIGADLHNEPHGAATWGDGNPATDWRLAAERGGNAILAVNPNWLIIVEGVESYHGDYYWWGGNLEGARQFPVRLSLPDKLVYSPHDYGPEVWPQAWFQSPNFARSLAIVWEQHWAYLQADGIAPVLLGEFGGRSVGNDPGGQWQRTLAHYIKGHAISYTYWSWGPDSGDTGGLLENDWKTIDPNKLSILPYLS
jgi:endoglucanase